MSVTTYQRLCHLRRLCNKLTFTNAWSTRTIHTEDGNQAGDKKPLSVGKQISVEYEPPSSGSIRTFLTKSGLSFDQGHTCFITTCPRHKRKLKLGDTASLFVNMTTGYFVCKACKKSGSWHVLEDNISFILTCIKDKRRKPAECFTEVDLPERKKTLERVNEIWESGEALGEMPLEARLEICAQFGIKELTAETLTKFCIRVVPSQKMLLIPSFELDGSVGGLKILTYTPPPPVDVLDEDDWTEPSSSLPPEGKVTSRTIPRNNYDGLFGWNTVLPKHTDVVLTASEFDAMAIAQATGLPALALPKGDSVLPLSILPLLEQFKKIILWLGGDHRTWQNTLSFARKLNENRCCLIRPEGGQPNSMAALRSGLNLASILRQSRPVKHDSIVTFKSLRNEVRAEFENADARAGIKWQRYPVLNGLLKGHRRGELTVFTGPTGSGKTTFISDYSLDLSLQGVNTLWGSFEINNVRLMKTMIRQFAQVNLVENLHQFNHFADKFEQVPMYLMTFHGQESIRKVIATMSHAVYVHDIAHVIVDNLQFMMGTDSNISDRFLRQEHVIAAFRQFATNMNCHITLVIHPRKEKDTEELTVSSIFGSAKASQEADNILIIQDKRLSSVKGRKYLQVAKNRFDGELGVMLLKFNKDSLSFSAPPKSSVSGSSEGRRRRDGDSED